MAAAGMPSSWADLPTDLLGQVLQRLPSLADRVRLRAVCRPWRAGSGKQRHPRLPPPLPWLALCDGTLFDLSGAPVRCPPILRGEGADFGYLAVDNLAFVAHRNGECSLMNPLSGLRLPLPKLGAAVRRAIDESEFYNQAYIGKAYVKAVLSSPLNSIPDALIAALILEGYHVAISGCKQGNAINITICPDSPRIHDIAFFRGKLYALTAKEGLYVAELEADCLSKTKSSSGFCRCVSDVPEQREIYFPKQLQQIHFPDAYPKYLVMRYLAESNGRLLMMRRWMSIPPRARLGDHDKTVRFEVFEADFTTVPGQWTKVESLGDQAIFLDSECSKSVLASQCADGVQEDCIYFMHQVFDNHSSEIFGPCVDPLADSGVYNMRNGEIKPLLPVAVIVRTSPERQLHQVAGEISLATTRTQHTHSRETQGTRSCFGASDGSVCTAIPLVK